MNRTRLLRLFSATLACVAALLFVARAEAQGAPRLQLLVAGAPAQGLSAKQAADLVEESAYIADDFGLYTVSRTYQVESVAGRDLARAVEKCAGKEGCLVPALAGSLFDYVLLVQPTAVRDGVEVGYKLLDVRAGIAAASTLARLPGPVEFAYLLGACQEALKATPDYIAPNAAAPMPVVVQQQQRPVMFPTEASQTPIKTQTWLYGSSAFLLASGTLIGFAADDVQQELQARPHTAARVAELQDDGDFKQTVANIAFGVGAALLATGVVFQVMESEDEAAADVVLRTDLRSLSLGFQF